MFRLSQVGIFSREEIAQLRAKIADAAVIGETELERRQRAFEIMIEAMAAKCSSANDNEEAAGSLREEADRSPAP
jgi:hypothetical protein